MQDRRNYVVFIRTDDMKTTLIVKNKPNVLQAVDEALERLHIGDADSVRELRVNDTPSDTLGNAEL